MYKLHSPTIFSYYHDIIGLLQVDVLLYYRFLIKEFENVIFLYLMWTVQQHNFLTLYMYMYIPFLVLIMCLKINEYIQKLIL